MNDHTVLGWLFHLCDHDGALFPVRLVEVRELLEWVIANDIGVEHEERAVILAENLLREFQRSSSAQWLGLDGELYPYVVLLLILPGVRKCPLYQGLSSHLLKRSGHDFGAVVDCENNIRHASCRKSLDLVKDHGLVAELDKGLWESESERSQTGAEATDENQS